MKNTYRRLTSVEDVFRLMSRYGFPMDRTWRKLTPEYRAAIKTAMVENNYHSINGPEGFYNAMRAFVDQCNRAYERSEKVHKLIIDGENVYQSSHRRRVVRVQDFHGTGIIETERVTF